MQSDKEIMNWVGAIDDVDIPCGGRGMVVGVVFLPNPWSTRIYPEPQITEDAEFEVIQPKQIENGATR